MRHRQAWLTRIVAAALLLIVPAAAASPVQAADAGTGPPAARPYIFGLFPFLAQKDIEGIFTPLAAEVSRALNYPVEYESTATFDRFNELISEQRFDIAHLQPFDYVRFAAPAGYLPLATRLDPLSAIFVVKPDSPLQKAEDLRGKRLGLPPKPSASAYLSRVTLVQSGIDPEKDLTVQYFGTHQGCLQQLLIGDIDVCSAGKPIVRFYEAKMGRTFRTILASPEITQTLFVVHKRVPAARREIIQKTLIASQLEGVSPELRALFLPGAVAKGPYFRIVTDKEYDNVRQYLKLMGEK